MESFESDLPSLRKSVFVHANVTIALLKQKIYGNEMLTMVHSFTYKIIFENDFSTNFWVFNTVLLNLIQSSFLELGRLNKET